MCSLSKWLTASLVLLFILVLSVVMYVVYKNDMQEVQNVDTQSKHMEDLQVKAKGEIAKALDQVAAK